MTKTDRYINNTVIKSLLFHVFSVSILTYKIYFMIYIILVMIIPISMSERKIDVMFGRINYLLNVLLNK